MPKKLRNTTHPLKGAKKPTPPADTHPYMSVKRYGEPEYFRSLEECKKRLVGELMDDRWVFAQRLEADDAAEAIDELISAVQEVGVDGGTVSGVLDPYSGIKYHVQILLRSPV